MNRAGSILPSEGYNTLIPQDFGSGKLRVVSSDQLDTYFLLLDHDQGASIVAEHPNGHSCRALADRMVAVLQGARPLDYALAQRQYIEDCGGMVRPLKAFHYWLGAAEA